MRISVTGAGGFISGHLVKRLLDDGHEVRAVDIKPFESDDADEGSWWQFHEDADNYEQVDLSDPEACGFACHGVERVFNLAAFMGGMGTISRWQLETGRNVLISTNMIEAAARAGVDRYLYTSSACCYPEYRQLEPDVTGLREQDAWPAAPQDLYGLEKLFSEELALRYARQRGLSVRLPRLHNCYGPHGSWTGGREKAPAALAAKVARAVVTGQSEIEIWGDGEQTRSFMFVDDCVEGFIRLAGSDYAEPINLGSEELVSVNQLVTIIEEVAGVTVERRYIDGPQGVRGRNSENTLIRKVLDWEPSTSLRDGIAELYPWIEAQVRAQEGSRPVVGDSAR